MRLDDNAFFCEKTSNDSHLQCKYYTCVLTLLSIRNTHFLRPLLCNMVIFSKSFRPHEDLYPERGVKRYLKSKPVSTL